MVILLGSNDITFPISSVYINVDSVKLFSCLFVSCALIEEMSICLSVRLANMTGLARKQIIISSEPMR